MREGPAGDKTGVLLDGALPQDPFPDYELPGELVMRDGMLVRLVPDHAVPDVPDDLMLSGPMFGGTTYGVPDTIAGLDRPAESGLPPGGLPDGVPVALWPVDLVRRR
ncbi:hypothetical protein [Promicromonospora soli]|uniref:Uncharacterized protein n=1 Tax=Promicromonospora soli TaxID=2035533 RepID=A0A919L030_9MICO|nr:hypothetical protein [Promicromonospora soli]GHH79032.1 hypothetical protein GCM10017772_43940 [Promicromonospora soli]